MKNNYWLLILFFLPTNHLYAAEQTCNPNIIQSTPIDSFIVNGNGTATDTATNLVWKQCIEGKSGSDCMVGSTRPLNMDWKTALEYADSHIFAGHDDWRLPNVKELASIVEHSCIFPAINLSVFSNVPSYQPLWFWSSTPFFTPYRATLINFVGGSTGINYRNFATQIRLVRDNS